MKNTVILLSGVHGVGKGFYIENKLSKIDWISVVSASSMISEHKRAEDAGYKRVESIDNNQGVLLKAFNKCSFNTDIVILDGHLVLLNRLGNIERIPLEFIQGIPLSGIILLQDNSAAIAERLNGRDGDSLSVETIELIQENEYMYCQYLSSNYGIPFLRVSHDEPTDDVELFLQKCEVSNEE